MHRNEVFQRQLRDRLVPAERRRHDPRPVGGALVTLGLGPDLHAFRRGKGGPVTAQMQLELAGQDQVRTTTGTGEGERMLEKRQQRVAGQLLAEKRRDLPHQATGGRQGQRTPGGIVGADAPAVQRGSDPAGQVAVG